MLKYLLDTNICIYTIKNKPPEVRALFNEHQAQLCMSAITLMEASFIIQNISRFQTLRYSANTMFPFRS